MKLFRRADSPLIFILSLLIMKSKIGCNPAVAERFQELFNYLRSKALVHKQKDLAKLIGATEANVSRLLSGDDRYTTKSMIARINHASGYPFSEDYLLRGEGTLLSDPESSVSERELREACEEEPSALGSRTLLHLPVIPTTLEAGIGRGILYERDDTQDLEDVYAAYASMPVSLDRETSHRYQLFCVRDDSMTDGTRDSLYIGDILLCREAFREDWMHGLIGRYPNVVVVTEEGVLLRRLTKHDRKQETISLHSLNGGDEDRIIALQDVKAFFYVERLIERHLSQW